MTSKFVFSPLHLSSDFRLTHLTAYLTFLTEYLKSIHNMTEIELLILHSSIPIQASVSHSLHFLSNGSSILSGVQTKKKKNLIVFLSYPISNLSANPVVFAFEIYLEFNHFSPHLSPALLQLPSHWFLLNLLFPYSPYKSQSGSFKR